MEQGNGGSTHQFCEIEIPDIAGYELFKLGINQRSQPRAQCLMSQEESNGRISVCLEKHAVNVGCLLRDTNVLHRFEEANAGGHHAL